MSLTSAGDCTTAAEKARPSFLKAPRPSGRLVAGAAQRGRAGLHRQALVLLTAGYLGLAWVSSGPLGCAGRDASGDLPAHGGSGATAWCPPSVHLCDSFPFPLPTLLLCYLQMGLLLGLAGKAGFQGWPWIGEARKSGSRSGGW